MTATRREFLQAGAATSGALLLGFHLPVADATTVTNASTNGTFAPNAFIRIDRQGAVTLVMPMVEMGQGVYTSVAMILADELDASWDRVRLEPAPPDDKLYGNPIFQIQVTGNSNSIRAFWKSLRTAGAGARAVLVQAAAKRWNVGIETCATANGTVTHQPSGRSLTYAALVDEASRLTAPSAAPLKKLSDFKLIGKPLKRLDTPDKVNGKAIYGIDALPPGVRFAALAICPVFGGKVGRVDDTKAKQVAGVHQVVVLDDFVAVVGEHTWAAKQGLAALEITWDEGPNTRVTTEQVWQQLRAASEQPGVIARAAGNVAEGLRTGDRLDAAYELPFLAHAQMEPLNCTVHVKPDSCEVWVGSQVLSRAQSTAAAAAGLPIEKVTVHNHLIGGGFGRRLEADMVHRAVRIGRHVDGPVKVIWSREEDIQHDVYRPVYRDVLAASVADGKIVGWSHRITGASIIARWLPPAFQKGIDVDAIDCGADIPYDIPHLQVEYRRDEPPGVPTGFWRGVGPNNNVFAIESFIDELAHHSNKDPVAFRRDLLVKVPRLEGGSRARGEQGRMGHTPAAAKRTRYRGPDRIWKLYRHGCRGGGQRARRGPRQAHGHCGGYRYRGQSRHRGGAIARRPDLRAHSGFIRRDHHQERARRAEQLQQLPNVAD